MLISIHSLQNYGKVNSALFLIGLLQYLSVSHVDSYLNSESQVNALLTFFVFLVFVLRNYTLLQMIDYGTKLKPAINLGIIPLEDYKYEFHVNVLTSTAVETITHVVIKTTMTQMHFSRNIYYEVLYFIPLSFLFEIIFDFFHYITHRLVHHKSVYKYLHKKHHKFKHPTTITTFYQDPVDLIITNSIPTLLSLCMIPYISYQQFHFMIVYKSFIEISGHSGKISFPTASFPQFMWLPKSLHIELYAEDHDNHHSLNNCNYAKRFSLWDKVFNTYTPYQNQI